MTSLKKMLGLLPPSSSVTGIRFWLAYCMISRPVVVSPVKAILAIRSGAGQRLAGLGAEALHDVEHARRQQVLDQVVPDADRRRGLLGGLEDDRVAGGQRRGELPDGHQDREVPRDDLADDAERLVEVVGDRVVVDLRQRALLRADGAGEVAEVVDGQRDVGGQRLAYRLAVVPASPRRRAARGSPPCGRRSCSGSTARSAALVLPHAGAALWAASRASSTSSAVERAISVKISPVTGEGFSKYWPLTGATYSPPMMLS